LFQHHGRAIDVRGKLHHKIALELRRLRIAPVVFSFVPLEHQLARQTNQPTFVAA
jgi:hypothetical protein